MSTEIVRANPAGPPATLDSQVRFAQLLSDADLLPKQFVGKPANVLYAIEYGRTLGIAPVAAITGIHVIEGKPSASSGLIGALVRQAGHKLRVKSDGATTATAEIVRADDPGFTYSCTWTLDRAAQAGLCKVEKGLPVARDRNGKPTSWEKYPAAMLKARAITEVARDACEDVLFGLHYTPEELGAVVNQDGDPVEAQVQHLRPVKPQTDDWSTPAPVQQTPPEVVAAGTADVPPESLTPAGRDYLHEALAAPDAATVRLVWQDAKAEGARDGYLAQIAEVGKQKAAAERAAGADPATGDGNEHPVYTGNAPDDVVDGEIVPDADSEHTAAVAELRAFAIEHQLGDIDREAESALGIPLPAASARSIRDLTNQLRGTAA